MEPYYVVPMCKCLQAFQYNNPFGKSLRNIIEFKSTLTKLELLSVKCEHEINIDA